MDSPTRALPPLSRLKPFEAAARHESFTLAAEELGMTQTAVSKQIGQLERDLGTKLFERRNRAVFLTDEGRRFGRVVSAAIADIAAEVDYLRGNRRSDELILHCQLCEAFYWLMPRLARFHVAIQTTGRPSGTARLAFTASDEIFPVCAPTLLGEADLPLPPAALATHPLLSHRVVPQEWMDWPDWFDAIGMSIPAGHRLIGFDSFPLVLQAAVSGRGIALGWRRTVRGMIDEGKLIRPCVESVARPTEIAIYHGAVRGLHPETDTLVAWLADELSD